MAEGDATSDDSSGDADHEDLFHALIFSSNTRADILSRLDECTDPRFAEYLKSCSEKATDAEEKQGLDELMDLIETVQTSVAEERAQEEAAKEAEAEAKAKAEAESEADDEETNAPTKVLSNADLLKQANAIDQAVMTSAMSDDEKPSDFISDCREVANLSRSFNRRGQMRVGGN